VGPGSARPSRSNPSACCCWRSSSVSARPDVLGLGALRWRASTPINAGRRGLAARTRRHRRDRRGSLRLHGQWPWPRTWLARLVGLLAEAHPAAIGIDLVMPEADRLSPGRVPEFVPGMGPSLVRELSKLPSKRRGPGPGPQRTTGRAGRRRPRARSGPAGAAASQAPLRTVGGDPRRFVPRYEATLRSVEEIDRVAKGHGLLNFEAERGVVRRMPLVAAAGGAVAPSFGVEILRVATGSPLLTVRVGASGVEAWTSAASSFHRAGRECAAPVLANRSLALRLGRRRSRRHRRPPCVRAQAGPDRRHRARPVRLPGDARDRADVGRGDPRPAARIDLRRRSPVPVPAPRCGRRPPCCSWPGSDSCWWCRDWQSGPRWRRSRSWSA